MGWMLICFWLHFIINPNWYENSWWVMSSHGHEKKNTVFACRAETHIAQLLSLTNRHHQSCWHDMRTIILNDNNNNRTTFYYYCNIPSLVYECGDVWSYHLPSDVPEFRHIWRCLEQLVDLIFGGIFRHKKGHKTRQVFSPSFLICQKMDGLSVMACWYYLFASGYFHSLCQLLFFISLSNWYDTLCQ